MNVQKTNITSVAQAINDLTRTLLAKIDTTSVDVGSLQLQALDTATITATPRPFTLDTNTDALKTALTLVPVAGDNIIDTIEGAAVSTMMQPLCTAAASRLRCEPGPAAAGAAGAVAGAPSAGRGSSAGPGSGAAISSMQAALPRMRE